MFDFCRFLQNKIFGNVENFYNSDKSLFVDIFRIFYLDFDSCDLKWEFLIS